MHVTLQLLTLLTVRLPPTAPAKHALTLNAEGGLCVTLNLGREWASFNLEEADLVRSAEEVADEILAMLVAGPSP